MTKVRKYIGTFTCDVCPTRVRVYDWLPEPLLCPRCSKREREREEREERTEGKR